LKRETLSKEFHNLYSSQSVIIMMKSRRMRWTGEKDAYRILVGKPEEKIPLGGLGVAPHSLRTTAVGHF
jgi:hypothetical protein